MKRTNSRVVLGASLPQVKRQIKENYLQVLFAIVFVVGVLCGVMCAKSASPWFYSWLTRLSEDYIANHGASFVQVFSNSLMSVLPALLIVVFVSFSALGAPVIFAVQFVVGLCYGCLSAYVCMENGLAGVAYTVLIILPHSLLSAFVLVLAAREAVRLSALFFDKIRRQCSGSSIYPDMRLSLFRQGFYLVLLVVSAFADALCSSLFSSIFPF